MNEVNSPVNMVTIAKTFAEMEGWTESELQILQVAQPSIHSKFGLPQDLIDRASSTLTKPLIFNNTETAFEQVAVPPHLSRVINSCALCKWGPGCLAHPRQTNICSGYVYPPDKMVGNR